LWVQHCFEGSSGIYFWEEKFCNVKTSF
jgi:hypothetical protein